MIFVGYEPGTKGYRVYDTSTRRVHVTRDVMFDVQAQWDWGEQQTSGASEEDTFMVEYTPMSQMSLVAKGTVEATDLGHEGATPVAPPTPKRWRMKEAEPWSSHRPQVRQRRTWMLTMTTVHLFDSGSLMISWV